ncbi:MAG: hypothetical protein ACR2F2_13850 [Pyrinomonadaceae bacterium]
MEFNSRQPKIKDSLYGEMLWEDDYEDGEYMWFADIEDEINGQFQIYIIADSPSEFMAVRNTHSTYKKLLADLPNVRKKTVLDLIKNEEIEFNKKRQNNFAIEKIEKTLELHSIKIYQDLSSTVCFDSEMLLGDSDEFIFTLIGSDGKVLEAEIGFY